MKASDRYFVKGVTCSLDGHRLRVANLSVGGLFAATTHPPMPGQVVWLELTLGDRPPFPVMGTVTWINGHEKPKAADLPEGFGVKITRIAFPHKLAILDLLKRLRPVSRTTKG
jgi:hypothetical protein